MKLLLFGATGQVGWELQRALAPLGTVAAPRIDFRQTDALAAAVRQLRPDAIVNAAAYTAVDRAESEPELAFAVNGLAPGVLAREAAGIGAWLVHYSTDYVFDGSGDAPRDESAATAPLNVYGRSKLEGEQRIAEAGGRHLILRTSWVHGARGGNFAKTMLRLAAERERLTVVADQVGAPTGADLVADLTAHVLPHAMRRPELAGLYHATAAGETSWHGYACHVVAWARAHGHPVKVEPGAIEPVATRDYPTPAPRPLNSRLATGKLRGAFDLAPPPWQAGVDRLLAELLER